MKNTWDKIAFQIAHILPKRIAFWAYMRVFSYTTRAYPKRHVDSLTFKETHDAWYNDYLK